MTVITVIRRHGNDDGHSLLLIRLSVESRHDRIVKVVMEGERAKRDPSTMRLSSSREEM